MCNVLLGGAIGDALGVFAESKLPDWQPLINWDGKEFLGSEHHQLLPGQYSDDTMFSMCVAKSLIENSGFNPDDLSKRYVELFTSNTIKGFGKTTYYAIQNLVNGIHWSNSGIVGSYGNGTAMRAAPFGIFFRNDLYSLVNIVKIDSAITHASDDAEAGAIAIALAAAYAVNKDTDNLLEKILPHLPECKLRSIIASLDTFITSKYIKPKQAFMVLGTKANVVETVSSCLYAFLKYKTYEEAVIAVIKAGGDTDTLGSITGALFAARDGTRNIPQGWMDEVEDKDKLIILDSQLYLR
jgi:ADP-ribosylglycohydrolase